LITGYRLHDPGNNSVVISKDVVIMEDTKEEVEVSIFSRSASKDNSREKIIDSVGEKIEEEEKEKISCEKNITTEVKRSKRTPKPRKLIM